MAKTIRLVFLALCLIGVETAPFARQVNAEQAAAELPPDFRLAIPSIGLDLPVGEAHTIQDTWYIPRVTNRVEHLQARPLPGQNDNVPLAGHVDLGPRRPAAFFKLKNVALNDTVYVTYDGMLYTYIVERMWLVVPTDISPLYPTDHEMLTLITCGGDHVGSGYAERLIVRATMIGRQVVPHPESEPSWRPVTP
ncbi:MAG TPA: sortase [Aggregatilineales bacterium]|nr:sortase [Aggregatilineales bacterium]